MYQLIQEGVVALKALVSRAFLRITSYHSFDILSVG
jgi:hypothetical protein